MNTATNKNILELHNTHGFTAEQIADGLKLTLEAVQLVLGKAEERAIALAGETGDSDERGRIAKQFDQYLETAKDTIVQLCESAENEAVRLKAAMHITEMCNGTLSPRNAIAQFNINDINVLIQKGGRAYEKQINLLQFSEQQPEMELPMLEEKVG